MTEIEEKLQELEARIIALEAEFQFKRRVWTLISTITRHWAPLIAIIGALLDIILTNKRSS